MFSRKSHAVFCEKILQRVFEAILPRDGIHETIREVGNIVDIPSRELAYPLPRHSLKMSFLFPFGGICCFR